MNELTRNRERWLGQLAELIVAFGANVQPDQIVSITSEPGKEPLARAVAEAAYVRGARFVDVWVFDQHVKRARLRHAPRDSLGFVPPWYGDRLKALGEARAALVSLTGPVAPRLLADIDPELVGLDMLPRVRESGEIVNRGLVNWVVAPCPVPGWAAVVHPDLPEGEALERLWAEVAHVCRLEEPSPAAAWAARLEGLARVTARLNALQLDSVRFTGPGTDLIVGLLPGSRWASGQLETVSGVVHTCNIPTEEVFSAPDPARTDGWVSATKPLFASGAIISGLRVRFQAGRAVQIEADEGAEILQAMARRDEGAARLGEIALVDRESRIGGLGTVFYETLLDENAASHIALGRAYDICVDGEDLHRINQSEIHVDFMIGSPEVDVTARRRDGTEVALLRGGEWQI
jgi:aminopeptidase